MYFTKQYVDVIIMHLLEVLTWYDIAAVCLSIFLWICDMAGLLRGTFVSWWYLPRIWPSVTDMQYYYHARYHIDDWHPAYMFSLVYFSVEVCLKSVFSHSVSTWRDSCVRVYAPLTLAPSSRKKQNRTGRTQLSTWTKRGGIWTDALICLHLPPGALWWGTFQWGSHGGEKIHHRGVSSGWSSIWSCSNIGSPGQQDEHIPILFGVWPFAWLFSFHFRAIGFDGVLVKFYYICQNCSSSSGWYIIAACVSTIVLGFS